MNVEPFGPGSMHWDTAGEYRNLLVAGSALVLQTMHPAVGAAVAEHSTYKDDPWGRLNRTLASVQKWVYGGEGVWPRGGGCASCTAPSAAWTSTAAPTTP
ncbi:oxygenase MpaB family protein [Nonomuraea sp. NPDC004702]